MNSPDIEITMSENNTTIKRQKPRKRTPEFEKMVIELLKELGTAKAVKKKLGVGYQLVLDIMKDNGIRSAAHKISPEVERQIVDLRMQKVSNAEIAKIMDVSIYSVGAIGVAYGLPKANSKRTDSARERIAELAKSNTPDTEIAKLLNISRSIVRELRAEMSLPGYSQFILTPQIEQRIVELRRTDGYGSTSISRMLDVGQAIVRGVLHDHGLMTEEYKFQRRTKEILPTRICIDCPEKGEQSIEYFHKRMNCGKETITKRCEPCFQKHEKALQKAYSKKQRSDPWKRLRQSMSIAIGLVIKSQGGSKNRQSTWDNVPYTPKELYVHIESLFEPWMTKDNYGKYDPGIWNDNDPATWKWQLDHIIPQADLPYTTMQEANFQKCWALENLRPLSAKQNNHDGTRRTRHTTPRKKPEPRIHLGMVAA